MPDAWNGVERRVGSGTIRLGSPGGAPLSTPSWSCNEELRRAHLRIHALEQEGSLLFVGRDPGLPPARTPQGHPDRSAGARAATKRSTRGQSQSVTDPSYRVQQGGSAGIDLLAQVADVGLQHPRIATEVVTPHVVQKLPSREDAARVEHQIAQQAELRGRQLDRSARLLSPRTCPRRASDRRTSIGSASHSGRRSDARCSAAGPSTRSDSSPTAESSVAKLRRV